MSRKRRRKKIKENRDAFEHENLETPKLDQNSQDCIELETEEHHDFRMTEEKPFELQYTDDEMFNMHDGKLIIPLGTVNGNRNKVVPIMEVSNSENSSSKDHHLPQIDGFGFQPRSEAVLRGAALTSAALAIMTTDADDKETGEADNLNRQGHR